MESQSDQPPLIVIVGETGSGKSSLAIALARRFNGEVIAADSRTVYRGMDIGTAKPSLHERQAVPHHLIDVVDPSERFTAADFKELANEAIKAIASRAKLPILVGGTGLYVDSVLYDFSFRDQPDMAERQRLQGLSVEELQDVLTSKGIKLPVNQRNPRHLIRAIETGGVAPIQSELRANTLLIGLQVDREVLRARITERVDAMIKQGVVDEARMLAKDFGWDAPGLQSPGYRTFSEYIAGKSTLEAAKATLITEHMQLAKRQRTWFKRNKNINWLCKQEEIVDLVTTFLNKVYTDSGRSLLQ